MMVYDLIQFVIDVSVKLYVNLKEIDKEEAIVLFRIQAKIQLESLNLLCSLMLTRTRCII